MPWRAAVSIPFTRLDVVAQVPSASGVYAVVEGGVHRFIGGTWNLKARLLELANVLEEGSSISVTFELCPEADIPARKQELTAEFEVDGAPSRRLPGISLYEDRNSRTA